MAYISDTETTVLCVGDNSFGQLGLGNKLRSSTYHPVPFGQPKDNGSNLISDSDVINIECGSQLTIVIKRNGQLKWCGTCNGTVTSTLRDVAGIVSPWKFVQVSCGRKHILGLLECASVVSWGIGFFGQLGHGDDGSWDNPKIIQSLEPQRLGDRVAMVVCGGSHSGVVTDSGQVYMWGLNRNGQCGITSKSDTVLDPRLVDFSDCGSVQLRSLVCGRNHSLALADTGRVYAWGSAGFGRLGINDSKKKHCSPVEIVSLAHLSVHTLAVGDFHNLALTTDHNVYSWGYNAEGQCGHGHVFNIRTPQRVVSLDEVDVSHIACGASWSVALSSAGAMFVWGYGDGGWLGVSPPRNMPVIEPEGECSPDIILGRMTSFHNRSFESRHNILAPSRVRLLADYHVTGVRCGGAHCVIFAHPRSLADSKSDLSSPKLMSDSARLSRTGTDADTSMDSSDDDAGSEGKADRPTDQLVFSWCRHRKIALLSQALVRGLVDVNIRDAHGNSPLIIAGQNGHTSVCQLLLDHGADPRVRNYKGNSVLHYCFAFSFKDLGDYLISKGADEFAVNNEGLTCFEGLTISDLDAL